MGRKRKHGNGSRQGSDWPFPPFAVAFLLRVRGANLGPTACLFRNAPANRTCPGSRPSFTISSELCEETAMSQLTLESLSERITVIEKILAEMRQEQPRPSRFKDWRKAAGMLTASELMKQVDELGRQIREADREESNGE